jgi:hypothetical protein
MEFLILLDRCVWIEKVDGDAVLFDDLFSQFQRFLELIASLQVEDIGLGCNTMEHLEDDHPFGTKCCRHDELIAESIDSPFQDVLWSRCFESSTHLRQF